MANAEGTESVRIPIDAMVIVRQLSKQRGQYKSRIVSDAIRFYASYIALNDQEQPITTDATFADATEAYTGIKLADVEWSQNES